MHILIGMAVATVLIILWAQGSLFACVFLSLAPALGALIFLIQSPHASPWWLACVALIVVIWTPRYVLLRRERAVWNRIRRRQRA